MRILLFIFCFCSFSSYGQTSRFRNELKRILEMEDTVWAMNPSCETGSDQVNIDMAAELVRENVLALCQKNSRKTEIYESQTLLTMANTCAKFFRSKKFSKRDKMHRLNREVRRIRRPLITKFGIIKVYSFTVPIYDKNNGKYFYDRKGPDGEPNLYKGNKKRLKRELEKDEELEYVHLDGLSKDEINKLILRQLSKKKMLPILKKGLYSYVGIQTHVNKVSNRKQISEIRVVLFFGARRLHAVKTKSNLAI